MAEPDFFRFIPPNLRQPLNEAGALAYQLYDNVVGIDDNYDSTGELLARSLREDPIGTAGSIASGVVDSAKAAYEDPVGTLSAMGNEFATAYEMLSTPMALDASREEVGQRLEAASLLSSVVPALGAAQRATRLGPTGSVTAALSADLRPQAPVTLYHSSDNPNLTLEDIEIVREGARQGRRGRATAGFYTSPDADYAARYGGNTYEVELQPWANIQDASSAEELMRITPERRQEYLERGVDVLRGTDIRGLPETVILNRDAISQFRGATPNDSAPDSTDAFGNELASPPVEINVPPPVLPETGPDTFEQTPFFFDEPEFNPNAFDPEGPPEDWLDDVMVPGSERYTNPVPLPDTLPASRFPDANPYNTDQGSAYSPLTWSSNEGIAGLYSRSARAAQNLRQPAYGDINQLRRELESRGAPPKELDLQMEYLQDLFAASPTGRVSAEDVRSRLSDAPGIEVVRTDAFAPLGPSGGQNYTSTVYTHPSVQDGPGAALQHFQVRSGSGQMLMPLFHTRAAQYAFTPDGSPATTHHVLEIQSDWAQHRQTLVPDMTPEAAEEAQRQARNLVRQGRIEEAEELVNRPTRAELDERFPAPLIKNENDWVDAGVRQNLLDAVNSGSDWITFGNGLQANQHVGMPRAAAERFYDRQVPLSVERVLRKLSREAGVEFPELQDVPFVDGQTVKGLRITPELRETLIQNGLPSFRDGGTVTASEYLLAGKQF